MLLENGDIIEVNDSLNIFDIKEIFTSYQNNYGFLYEHNDNVAGFREALNFYNDNFSTLMENENFKKYIFALCTLKQDCFTSDREIVALMFACSDYNMFLE